MEERTAALQLAELLLEPKESLDVEIKSRLDLMDREHAGPWRRP